jgi:hypothetical protein
VEDLRKRRADLKSRSDKTLENMNTIAMESYRVADVAQNAKSILAELNEEFEYKTKLNGVDISFLFLATALQCVRQYVFSNKAFRFENDKVMGDYVKGQTGKISNEKVKDNIRNIFSAVPYDAVHYAEGKEAFQIATGQDSHGISGRNHRYTVLGHDPLLGWIFGTANILTDTLTKNNITFTSYDAAFGGSGYKVSTPTTVAHVFARSVCMVREDKIMLPFAVAKQAAHMLTDAFTKQGLPIPVLNSISPSLSGVLIDNGIDLYSVTRGAALASLINMLIASIHGLFYDADKYPSRDLYEVKTRKILCYSNLLASASNVIYVALSKDLSKLDVGGILVTIYRLIVDSSFKRKVKEEFIFGSFDKMIQGEEYNF